MLVLVLVLLLVLGQLLFIAQFVLSVEVLVCARYAVGAVCWRWR